MAALPELYVAVDVEADGPIPGPYSMISLGMAVTGRPDLTFYTTIKPISEEFLPEALRIDLRSYWMGRTGCEWASTGKRTIKRTLGLAGLPHTHHAGEDAAELAQIFDVMAHEYAD